MSPALAGKFPTTVPPGKSLFPIFVAFFQLIRVGAGHQEGCFLTPEVGLGAAWASAGLLEVKGWEELPRTSGARGVTLSGMRAPFGTWPAVAGM